MNLKLYGGGIIIHISGSSGSGKTTLGNKLKEKFGDRIIVKDIDDLRWEFIKNEYGEEKIENFNNIAYQKWIDNFIMEQNKPIVFVGLNNMPWWNKDLYYNMHAKYNFYITLDSSTIFKQKCGRFISDIYNHKDEIIEDFIIKSSDTIMDIKRGVENECNYKEINRMNDKWNSDYEKQGYIFLPPEEIFNRVSNILDKYFD